jgi:hypothetical protein
MTQHDEVEILGENAMFLCRLKIATEGFQECQKKVSKFLEAKDRVELAKFNVKLDEMYYKYFERFIRKVRGLE